MAEKRKEPTTNPSKPLPTRTPSTRIQEPTLPHTSSTMKRTESAYTKNNSASFTTDRPERPPLQRRRTTAQTRYIEMLLNLDNIPRLHNILASFFTWILLAGYIVFPATFNSIKKNRDLDEKANNNLEAHALATVRNAPLLYVAAFACGIGVAGCAWLWWKHRGNYVWVINRIWLPSFMNSIAGLISTIVNIYSAQNGQYSVTAKVTTIVTAVCSVVTLALFLLYNSIMLEIVKRKHAQETRDVERGMSFNDNDPETFTVDEKGKKAKAKAKKHGGVGADPGRIV